MENELSKILYNILVNYTYEEYNEAYNIAKAKLLHISSSYNTVIPVCSDIAPVIPTVTAVCPVEPIHESLSPVETIDENVKNINVVDNKSSISKQTAVVKRVLTKKEQRDKERETKKKNRENKVSEKSLLTKDNLQKWYCDEGYSAAYIAREFIGCRQEKVGDALKAFGIQKK